jgi:hypothetical protein
MEHLLNRLVDFDEILYCGNGIKGDSILKGSDDGVLYLIKPRFWTLSIVSDYKNTTTGRPWFDHRQK